MCYNKIDKCVSQLVVLVIKLTKVVDLYVYLVFYVKNMNGNVLFC
jgi:hypothetical protein